MRASAAVLLALAVGLGCGVAIGRWQAGKDGISSEAQEKKERGREREREGNSEGKRTADGRELRVERVA